MAFHQLTNLTCLNLDKNKWETLDVKLFEKCSNLKELYLNDNQIKHVYRDTFEPLQKSIQISNNQIKYLFVIHDMMKKYDCPVGVATLKEISDATDFYRIFKYV